MFASIQRKRTQKTENAQTRRTARTKKLDTVAHWGLSCGRCTCARAHSALARHPYQSRVGGGRPVYSEPKVQEKPPVANNKRLAQIRSISNKAMTTPATNEKMLVNALSLALLRDTHGLVRWRYGVAPLPHPPNLDFTPRDVGMVVANVALAMANKGMLIKQGIIPVDIMYRWLASPCLSVAP